MDSYKKKSTKEFFWEGGMVGKVVQLTKKDVGNGDYSEASP